MLLSHKLVIIMLWVGFWLRNGFWLRRDNLKKKKKSVLCEDTAVPPFPQNSGEPGQPGELDHGLTATGEVQKSRGNQQLALGISFQLLDLPWKH